MGGWVLLGAGVEKRCTSFQLWVCSVLLLCARLCCVCPVSAHYRALREREYRVLGERDAVRREPTTLKRDERQNGTGESSQPVSCGL